MYNYLRVKLRRLQRKMYEDKYDICDKKLWLSLQITAGPSDSVESKLPKYSQLISYHAPTCR